MQYTLTLNRRWCDGRASYRPPTESIRTAVYEVAEISEVAGPHYDSGGNPLRGV